MKSTFFKPAKINIFLSILFSCWLILFYPLFIQQLKSIRYLSRLYFLTEDQKYQLLDGEFYWFMKLCDDFIPKKTDVIFEIIPKEPELYSRDWYMKEYFIQKTPYYLYPRKIFNKKYIGNKSIDYQIVYNTLLKKFQLFYKYDLILYVDN